MFNWNSIPADSGETGILGQALGRLARALRQGEVSSDRRQHSRLPAHGPLKLVWRGDAGDERETDVHAIDVCPRGLAFRSACEVAVGLAVSLMDGYAVLSGEVRHCTPDGEEYSVGIEIQNVERLQGDDRVSGWDTAIEVAIEALQGSAATTPSD